MIYHQAEAAQILKELNVSQRGLTHDEVSRRRALHGPNAVPQPKSKSIGEIFFRQMLNPLIYVLIAAAVLSLATGDVKDALFITLIILFNSILGTYQEWRAENSARALQNMVRAICRVRRDGHVYEIASADLVPGDIVLLESGFKVPADLRLLEVHELSVEEAMLTGESMAVDKSARVVQGDDQTPIGDRVNMAFAATTVQHGRAVGVVIATGANTQIGLIADSLRTTQAEKPPLVRRMERFSRKISVLVVVACMVLGLVGYLAGRPAIEIFFVMVAVGVSVIPEGLPIGLTVALSIATRRMAKRNVIVRKLPAVEGLGSCTLIASDKTGTLTMDLQCIRKIYLPGGATYDVTGHGYRGDGGIIQSSDGKSDENLLPLVEACTLANEASLHKIGDRWEHSGDPVDVAFIALAYKIGKNPE